MKIETGLAKARVAGTQGKGDRDRVKNLKAFQKNWGAIFGKNKGKTK